MTAPTVRAPDCPVDRIAYGDRERPCGGVGTYYCDEELWGSPCRAWQRRNGGYRAPDEVETAEPSPAERLAVVLDEAYQRIAPAFGIPTRPAGQRLAVRQRR